MQCPNCGRTNPPDKDFCYSCNAELPKPVEKKKRRWQTFGGFPVWMWAVLILLFIMMNFWSCSTIPPA